MMDVMRDGRFLIGDLPEFDFIMMPDLGLCHSYEHFWQSNSTAPRRFPERYGVIKDTNDVLMYVRSIGVSLPYWRSTSALVTHECIIDERAMTALMLAL